MQQGAVALRDAERNLEKSYWKWADGETVDSRLRQAKVNSLTIND